MTWSLVVRPEAAEELRGARDWYEDCRPGLGQEFSQIVLESLGSIQRAPHRWARVPHTHAEIRRALTRRFPYAVYYAVEPGQIVVLAIAHVRRRPGYWTDRR